MGVPVVEVGRMRVVMDHCLMPVGVRVVALRVERRGARRMRVAIVVEVVVPVTVLVDHHLVPVRV